MSLLAFQTELAVRIGSPRLVRSQDLLSEEDRLEAVEAARLTRVCEGRGLAFTATVRRSWCLMRAAGVARLTLSALPPDVRRTALEAWVEAGHGSSAFPASEADDFLEFLARRLRKPSYELSLCRFEQAVHRAVHAASWPRTLSDRVSRGCRFRVAPGATLASLVAAPPQILQAAQAGRPFPALAGPSVVVLFAPGIPGLWRTAHASEVGVFEACAAAGACGATVTSRKQVAAVQSLLSVGSLERVGGPGRWGVIPEPHRLKRGSLVDGCGQPPEPPK